MEHENPVIVTEPAQVAALKVIQAALGPDKLNLDLSQPGQVGLPRGLASLKDGRLVCLTLAGSTKDDWPFSEDFSKAAAAADFEIELGLGGEDGGGEDGKALMVSDPAEAAALKAFCELNNLAADRVHPLVEDGRVTALDLMKNRISDLSPLAGLTSLTDLHLWDNQVSDLDFSPLLKITSLKRLRLGPVAPVILAGLIKFKTAPFSVELLLSPEHQPNNADMGHDGEKCLAS